MADRGTVALVWLIVCVSLCVVHGIYMSYSGYGVLDVPENRNYYSRCYSEDRDRYISFTWELVQDTGTTLPLGICNVSSRECDLYTRGNLGIYSSSISSIGIYDVQRNMSGRLICSGLMADNTTETADVIVHVYNRPRVDNCFADVMRHNWSASFSCDITDAFSTANLYTFRLHERYLSNFETSDLYSRARDCFRIQIYLSSRDGWSKLTRWEQTFTEETANSSRSGHCGFLGHVSYADILTPYINKTNGREYFEGELVHSWKLSPYPADNFTIRVFVCTNWIFRTEGCGYADLQMSPISLPSKPRHNCTDMAYIPETGGPRCVCTAEDLGSPAGRLVWMRGDVTLAAGDYGVQQLPFPTVSLARDQGEGQVVCHLDWIKPDLAEPRLNVAYGPDNVNLNIYHPDDTNDRLLILIECQVTGLNPRTPDMVQWGGPCRGQAGFTCTLNPQENEVHGKAVTCRVTNAANNGHSVQAAATIRPVTEAERQAETSTEKIKWAGIGVAATLAVGVVVTLMVMLVLWICRRSPPCTGPRQSKKDADRDPANGNNTGGHTYESLALNRTRGRSLPPTPEPVDIYENTGFHHQEGHM